MSQNYKTVQFSETVTGFTSGDIVPVNGTVNNFLAVDGDTYTFDLTPSAEGPVTADIAAGVASDSVGNANTIAAQFSRTYSVTYYLFLPLILR
ncbi:MAG: Ig-like domain-containing protein [Anaerolineales bacterium]|nr:Ig-like domain-containing protein [Anaerolineales bacterium]